MIQVVVSDNVITFVRLWNPLKFSHWRQHEIFVTYEELARLIPQLQQELNQHQKTQEQEQKNKRTKELQRQVDLLMHEIQKLESPQLPSIL